MAFVLLTSLALAACGDGRGKRHEAQLGTLPEGYLRFAEYYDRMRRFESRTLAPFASDDALFHYLDTLALMQERFSESAAPGLPHLPEAPPPRQRPFHATEASGNRSNRQFEYGTFPERPQRLIAHDGRVFSLFDNTLRSFALEPTGKTLQQRAQLRLGARMPDAGASNVVGMKGWSVWRASQRMFEGVVQYDYLFASGEALILVGARWDFEALTIAVVRIGQDGELEHESTHDIYLRRRLGYGYRARWSNSGLAIYAQTPALQYGAWDLDRPIVYTLPWLSSHGPQGGYDHELLSSANAWRPQLHGTEPMLHMLVHCAFVSRAFMCEAQAINAPETDDFFMGSDAAYAWINGSLGEVGPPASTFLYRLPFNGAAPSAVRVSGPVEAQLEGGAHETADALHALVRKEGMLNLVEVARSSFSQRTPDLGKQAQRPLARNLGPGTLDQRLKLVAGHLVYEGGPEPRWAQGTTSRWMQVIDLASGRPFQVKLAHSPSIVAPLRDHALVVGSDSWNLHISVVAFDGDSGEVVATTQIRNAARDYSLDYELHLLPQLGDGGWFLLQTHAQPESQVLLPFRWSPAKAALQALPRWSAPDAPRRDFEPYLDPVDVLSIGADLVLVRMQEELLVQRLDPLPTLTQRLRLDPDPAHAVCPRKD